MEKISFDQLLDAGVHFGHLRRKWNPAMAPYIFMEKNGIHIIDLYKTQAKLEEAAKAMKQIVKNGKRILFVATKKQAKDIVAEKVGKTNMPYVTERWPGGMLTNFVTIRKAVKKMSTIDKLASTPQYNNLSKRERLQITRERAKLEKNFGSIADLSKLPSAIFVVDINKEHIAIAEAKKLNIPTFAIVDTNTDPNLIDFPIPGNDDASKSIAVIMEYVTKSINEGLTERKIEREKAQADEKASKAKAKEKKDAAAKAKAEAEATDDAKTEKPSEEKEGTEKRPRKRLAKKAENE